MSKTHLNFLSLNVYEDIRGYTRISKAKFIVPMAYKLNKQILYYYRKHSLLHMEYRVQNEWNGKCFPSYGTNHSKGVSIECRGL